MRVHLVTQICSKRVVNMIDNYAEERGGKEKYRPLRKVLLLLNNFIYIINGRKKVDFFSVQMMKTLMSYGNLVQFFQSGKMNLFLLRENLFQCNYMKIVVGLFLLKLDFAQNI